MFGNKIVCILCERSGVWVCFSLKVASQLLLATNGPVKAVEGSLDQRSHDAAHVHLISTAVSLTIMLHPQPATNSTDRPKHKIQHRTGSNENLVWRLQRTAAIHWEIDHLAKTVMNWHHHWRDCFIDSLVPTGFNKWSLTHVQSHVPPQKQRKTHPRGSKCSSSPGGTSLSLERNLSNREGIYKVKDCYLCRKAQRERNLLGIGCQDSLFNQ